MRDLDQIVGRVEEKGMQSEFAAGASGNDPRFKFPATPLLHLAGNPERGPARRVLLLGVMSLFHGRLVLGELRKQLPRASGQREHHVGPGGEVRSVDAADLRSLHAGADLVEPMVPAGGSNDQTYLRHDGQSQRTIDHLRVGEIDEHLGASDRR